MIPKIIHYCWFGPKPLPPMVKMCIATWKQHLPDYQLMCWNEENSPMDFPFVKEAYAKKKYAFVSDYVRLWAVYNHGGIYLDTDMFLIRPLDDFLPLSSFFAYEEPNEININAAIFGATAKHSFIEHIIKKYENLKICSDFTQITIPIIVTNAFMDYENKNDVRIFSYDFFYPFPHKKRRQKNYLDYSTDNTYSIHLWNFSWLTTKEKIILRFVWLGNYFGIKIRK